MKIGIKTHSTPANYDIEVQGIEGELALLISIATCLQLKLPTPDDQSIRFTNQQLDSYLASGSHPDDQTYKILINMQQTLSKSLREGVKSAINDFIFSPTESAVVEDSTELTKAPRRRRSPPREPVGEHIDPAVISVKDTSYTLQLALRQTIAARACLYWPSYSLKMELHTAAARLLDFLKFLKTQEKGDHLVIGLCARLLGNEGLITSDRFMDNQTKAYTDPAVSERLARLCMDLVGGHLRDVVDRVFDDHPELGLSRAVTVALLGDIGAFMAATGATTGTDRPSEVSKALKDAFSAYAIHLEGKGVDQGFVERSVTHCKELGGGEVIGPTKSKERIRHKGEELLPRTGIHDCGFEADEALGRADEPGHLKQTRWATARLDDHRVKMTEEPLAGHMSASPSEILWTWDVLALRGLANAYSGSSDAVSALQDSGTASPLTGFADVSTSYSFARAAGACAFLVGCGYHSALEVLHGTLVYVGQNPAKEVLHEAARIRGGRAVSDAGAIFHAGAATSLVEELIDDMTSRAGRAAKDSVQSVAEVSASQPTEISVQSTIPRAEEMDDSRPTVPAATPDKASSDQPALPPQADDAIHAQKEQPADNNSNVQSNESRQHEEVHQQRRAESATPRYMKPTIFSEAKKREKYTPPTPSKAPWKPWK